MIGYIGLLKIELPTHTAFLSDGGFLVYDGDTYKSSDSVLGSLQSVEPMGEGRTGAIPSLDLTFNIPNSTAITAFTTGTLQRSELRLWLAKYTVETGLISGDPELQYIGQLDQPLVKISRGEYIVSISTVPKAEWLFERDTGNTLSSSFHKSLYAGETGHDNATGLSISAAWGVEKPATSRASIGGSGGIGGFVGERNTVLK